MSSKKRKAEEAALLAEQQAAEAKAKAEAQRCLTKIPAGVTLVGTFNATEDIYVAGKIQGEVNCQTLNILAGGQHEGKANVENLELSGTMQSQVVCSAETHITESGIMCGILNSNNLSTDPGATIKAQVNLGKAMPKAAEPAAEPAAEAVSAAETAPAAEPAAEAE